jgi:hypothetical protein
MKGTAGKGRVPAIEWAFRAPGTGLILESVHHELRAEERRAAMTLGSLAENLARITEQYGPPAPAVTACPACGGRIEIWPPGPGEEAAADCGACGITVRFGAARPA